MKKIHLALVGICAVMVAAFAQDMLPLSAFPQSTLSIATPNARLHRFKIWIADDDRKREQGLMFQRALPDDAGMLFVYPAPQTIGIWMKNTYIPLDIVFIRADGRVARIFTNAKPMSLDVMQVADVTAVLELKGGTTERLNIAKGAAVMHPFFGSPARN